MVRTRYTLLAFAAAGLLAGAARADHEFEFEGLTHNHGRNNQAGEDQLRITLHEHNNQACFMFTNTGSSSMSITRIAFDDRGAHLGASTIMNGEGVHFRRDDNAQDIPGEDRSDPRFTPTFSFSSGTGENENEMENEDEGVRNDRNVDLCFNLNSGASFNDVFRDLREGRLRIGVHVRGFDDQSDESFLNGAGTGTIVPLPPAAGMGALAATGLLAGGAIRRRRTA